MPTVILTAVPAHFNHAALLVPVLPGIIAPHFNIEGAELHEGGVSADSSSVSSKEVSTTVTLLT